MNRPHFLRRAHFLRRLGWFILTTARKIASLLDRWGLSFEKRAALKAYAKNPFRIDPNGGRYFIRGNHCQKRHIVKVIPNSVGWYDKLPFIVLSKEGKYHYTVCERGALWPQWPSHNALDIVEKAE